TSLRVYIQVRLAVSTREVYRVLHGKTHVVAVEKLPNLRVAFLVGVHRRAETFNTTLRANRVNNDLRVVIARNIPQLLHPVKAIFLRRLELVSQREVFDVSLLLSELLLSGENLL